MDLGPDRHGWVKAHNLLLLRLQVLIIFGPLLDSNNTKVFGLAASLHDYPRVASNLDTVSYPRVASRGI